MLLINLFMALDRVVLDIPHGGQQAPSREVRSHLHPDIRPIDLYREADLYSTGFYINQPDIPERNKIVMHQLRAIVDVNRELDDFSPDGVVKTQTSRGQQLYLSQDGLSPRQRQQLVESYARPYMDKLTAAVEKPSTRLVTLCHTMDPIGQSAGIGAGKKRPLILLANGGDQFGNPDPGKPYQLPRHLMEQIKAEIESRIGELNLDSNVISNGQVVSFNKPYRGAKSIDRIGPQRLYGKKAFMIEVNKSLVMDYKSLRQTNPKNIAVIRDIIGQVIEKVLGKL